MHVTDDAFGNLAVTIRWRLESIGEVFDSMISIGVVG